MKRMARLILPLGLVAVTLVACRGTEGTTAPFGSGTQLVPAEASFAQGVNVKQKDVVKPLLRSSAVTKKFEVSQVIGPRGGEISIPSLGFKIQFPPGVVATNTQIRVVVKPGAEVAYEFYPHMTFRMPVSVFQDLAFTNAANNVALQNSIIGAYFPGELESAFENGNRGRVNVEELRAVNLDATRKKFWFTVDHFSGYLASSGRAALQAAEEDDR
jgi:hypothetical protein